MESTVDKPRLVEEFAKTPCNPLPVEVWKPFNPETMEREQPIRLFGFGRQYNLKIGHRYVHTSHRMACLRGLFYCRTCGAIGDMKIDKLAYPCDVRTAAGKENLRCIRAHEKPPSLRKREWPNLRRDKGHIFL